MYHLSRKLSRHYPRRLSHAPIIPRGARVWPCGSFLAALALARCAACAAEAAERKVHMRNDHRAIFKYLEKHKKGECQASYVLEALAEALARLDCERSKMSDAEYENRRYTYKLAADTILCREAVRVAAERKKHT